MPSEEEMAAAIAVAEEVHQMVSDIADLKARVILLEQKAEQPHDGVVAVGQPGLETDNGVD